MKYEKLLLLKLILVIGSILQFGCSLLVKRTGFIFNESYKHTNATKTCAQTGAKGDDVRLDFPGGRKLELHIAYGDGPAFLGPVFIPLVPIRISDTFKTVRVRIVSAPENVKLDLCNWTLQINNSSAHFISPLNKDKHPTDCENQERVDFVVSPPSSIDSLFLNIPELELPHGRTKAQTIHFKSASNWIFKPVLVMADQLGFERAPYCL